MKRFENLEKIQQETRSLSLEYAFFLKRMFPSIKIYAQGQDLYIKTTPKNIWRIAQFLKLHTNAQFKLLMEICGVDYPEKQFRFEVIYHFLSIHYNSRINLTVFVQDAQPLPSLNDIYPNSNWLEREVWDMFGVFFTNHKDLRRILTDYGFKGHPLRKDFPLTGYTETLYNDFFKNIEYQEVSLSQAYRNFTVSTE